MDSVKETMITREKNSAVNKMDTFVKLVLAVALAVIPYFCRDLASFAIVSLFLIIITLNSRISGRALLLSAASYGIIVILPYAFGFLMNSFIYRITGNGAFAYQQSFIEVFLKLFRLFFIWYISILYFQTVRMESFIGLMDKLLTPLKLLQVSVSDYLKVLMCIVAELKSFGPDIKKELEDKMSSVVSKGRWGLRINFKSIAETIVSLIVNSFKKLDRVQRFVENINPEDLFHYQFRWSKYDTIGICVFLGFAFIIGLIETGLLANIERLFRP